MRALVVYESMFGNTRKIAAAVADGIRGTMDVDLLEVGDAPPALPHDLALVVVGGPTHAHGMTTAKSRSDAAGKAGDRLVSRRDGIREWLDALTPAPDRVVAATFDTRIKGPELLWGSAAKSAAKQLRELGFDAVEPPSSFLVGGPTGSMFDRIVPGELERATRWGAKLGAEVNQPARAR